MYLRENYKCIEKLIMSVKKGRLHVTFLYLPHITKKEPEKKAVTFIQYQELNYTVNYNRLKYTRIVLYEINLINKYEGKN